MRIEYWLKRFADEGGNTEYGTWIHYESYLEFKEYLILLEHDLKDMARVRLKS